MRPTVFLVPEKVRIQVAALSGDPGAGSLFEGLPERKMGVDALALLCSARTSLKQWEEVRRLGAKFGPFLWERQLKRPMDEAAYYASTAETHLENWSSARDGFMRIAPILRHPGPYFALGVSLVVLGNIEEARRILAQIQMTSTVLSRKLGELIIQNSGIRKMMADPIEPGILDNYAMI